MGSCFKIIVNEDLKDIPSYYRAQNGEIEIELDDSIQIKLTDQVQSLTIDNLLNLSGVLSFDIPRTELNNIIFQDYILVNTINKKSTYNIVMMLESHVLEFRKLKVKSFNNKTITVDIDIDENHWISWAKNKKLTDINYDAWGSIELTKANLFANWANFEWQNDTFLGWFPLVWYGQFIRKFVDNGENTRDYPKTVSVGDFRPWLSVFGTMRQAFCDEGWTLKSPFLESPAGRRWWFYALSEEFYKGVLNPGKGQYTFQAQMTGMYFNIGGRLPFDDDFSGTNFDNGNNYDIANYWYRPLNFSYTMQVILGVRLSVWNNTGIVKTVTVHIILEDESNVQYDEFIYIKDIQPNTLGLIVCEWETNMYTQSYAFVKVDNIGVIVSGSIFYMKMNNPQLYEGDTIHLGKLLGDYNYIEFFKGIIGLIGGKLVTDIITKTLTIYTDKEIINIYNKGYDITPGFFVHETLDITPYTELSKTEIIFSDVKEKYIFKFKDSTDPFCIFEGVEKTLYSKTVTIDNNNIIKNETETYENPFFEPTLDGPLVTLGDGPDIIGPLYVPYLLDNFDAKISFNIQPRIVTAIGYVGQTYYPSIYNSPISFLTPWYFEDINGTPIWSIIKFELPFASQRAIAHINISNDVVIENIAYGEVYQDLFDLFIANSLFNNLGVQVNLDVLLPTSLFNKSFFQKLYYFKNSDGNTLSLKGTKITDFCGCCGKLTTISFIKNKLNTFTEPCQCIYTSCLFWNFVEELTPTEVIKFRLISLKVDGIEYVNIPISFVSNIITLEGQTYQTAIVNAINSVSSPLKAFNEIYNASSNRNGYYRLEWPYCQKIELIFDKNRSVDAYDSYYRVTEDGTWFAYTYTGAGTPIIVWTQDIFPLGFPTPTTDYKKYDCRTVDYSQLLIV